MKIHEKLVRQLMGGNSKIRKHGWRKAIKEALLSDEDSDFTVGDDLEKVSEKLVPDAYLIESQKRILTMYEVEVTSGLTLYKLKTYCGIYRILDYYQWLIVLVCINKRGIAQAYCLCDCYLHSLDGEVDFEKLTLAGEPYKLPLIEESVGESIPPVEADLLPA